jgi:CMP-N-acetylneuraminic acid synthetase
MEEERNNSALIIHHRKEALADDRSTVAEVCEDLLRDRKLALGTLGVFLPTCPLRKAQHIREAWKLYEDNGLKTISARQSKVPSWCIYAPTGPGERGKRLVDDADGVFGTNSKFVKRPWVPNGAIFITGIPQFLQNHSFYDSELNLYKMNDSDSLDIDTELDLRLARIIMG